jgi:hypothetical protein
MAIKSLPSKSSTSSITKSLWVDEFNATTKTIKGYQKQHDSFIDERIKELAKEKPKHPQTTNIQIFTSHFGKNVPTSLISIKKSKCQVRSNSC